MDVDFGRNVAGMIRELAAGHAPGRAVRLGLGTREARRLSALLMRAERLAGELGAEDEALSRLAGQSRVIEACARRAVREGGVRLPGWDGRTRIEVVLAELIAGGNRALTKERLLSALSELDAVQPLTVHELWAVPEALRVVVCKLITRLSKRVVRRAMESVAADAWTEKPNHAPGSGDAFIEAAVKAAGEMGRPDARRRLERYAERRGVSVEDAVARAQATRANDIVRLENLTDARRMVDALNWRACFEALSTVERELRGDPAGVYPRMDDRSRDTVREQVAHIARKTGVPERVVARHAVDAARAGEGTASGVSWWLYEDTGRRALLRRMGKRHACLRKIVPDPTGRSTVSALLMLAAILTFILACCIDIPLLWPVCLILGWAASDAIIGRLYLLCFKPARLLKLDMERVPDDCRTLVTIPALLSGTERAADVCAQLETLGCLEADENIEYLLLGDFADAPSSDMPGDAAVLECVRERIDAMNARAGRAKYAFLCRPRTLLKADNVWIGRDRKRGALTDLNRLLLGGDGAEAAFSADGTACGRLKGRFRYVVTLDVGTRLMPEDVRRLIGAMAHPLNRSYAVMQPRMEALPSGCVNAYVRLCAGAGGVNAYPVTVSNLWQDLTGRGIYGGKGIYDVSAFHRRLDGALPEGRVLSHDLIEGAIAGAGFVGDIAFYDAGPTTLGVSLRRLHRWTRGDWQLLSFIFSGKRRFGAADRFRMLDNLVRSLKAPALLALAVFAAWKGDGGVLLAFLVLGYLDALLRPFDCDKMKWRRATAELASLPAVAWCSLDAIGRALWRTFVSGRRMMDWVTAADAEGAKREPLAVRVPGRVAALIVLPGLVIPGAARAALALSALFAVGPNWIRDMEREPVGATPALSKDERTALIDIARDTWRFFAENVMLACTLPPDNVQLDPPVGAARRTSPTNIAMYLMSCLSALRLGFIDESETRARMEATVTTLEALEKWRGNLYNWYDIDTGAPLRPRYVSSVDSGNLAAALMLCANAAETGAALSARMSKIAQGMELNALYDGERELFFIGVDVEEMKPSAARYDLIASEARILSYAAMMLGQVPPRHWRRLGRACAPVAGGVAPLSWGGTMFEYLMPELFLDAPVGTLLGDGVRATVRAQVTHGRRLNRPWGVSESGYNALDVALNYQYRAFGLKALALDGEAEQDVVAPYAAALAAPVAPVEAVKNLTRMVKLGWSDRWGLYEAADYARGDGDVPALVKSHMAHHQGMALCALCNALTGGSLRRDFMAIPEARALSLLLEERTCPKPSRRLKGIGRGHIESNRRGYARAVDPDAAFPQVHLISGGEASAICTADGAVHYRRHGVDATRFEGTLTDRADAAKTYLTDIRAGIQTALFGATFEPGIARYAARLNRLEASMAVCLSPEDGTLARVVEVANMSDQTVSCAVTDVAPVALATEAAWRDHATFQRLFVESAAPEPGLLRFTRRPSGRGDVGLKLMHMAVSQGEVSYETDYDRLTGRVGDTGKNTVFDTPLPNAAGESLNSAGALRVEMEIAPGEKTRVCFMLGLMDVSDSEAEWAARWRDDAQSARTLRLAAARARTALGFISLNPRAHGLLQRMAALLVDGALAAEARGPRRGEAGVQKGDLWRFGVSGDLPIILMRVTTPDDGRNVRAVIRAYEFYRAMGLETDLVLVDDGTAGYARPVRDMIEGLISSGPLNRLRGVSGGAWVIDGSGLDGDARRALLRQASAAFAPGRDFFEQARALTAFAEGRQRTFRPMVTGASTLKTGTLLMDNGYGGFDQSGGYQINIASDKLPPAPWCNVLANDSVGMLLSERGGGYAWRGNSREGRLTPYGNDGMREGWGMMLHLVDAARGEALRLLPGDVPATPFRVIHDMNSTRYEFETRRVKGSVSFSIHPVESEINIDISIKNRALRGEKFELWTYVDWLMGAARRDAVALNCWREGGACLATGEIPGAGWLMAADPMATGGPGRAAFLGRGGMMAPAGFDCEGGEGWTLRAPVALKRGEKRELRFILGWSESVEAARERIQRLRVEPPKTIEQVHPALIFDTPDPALNALANGFLVHQVLASRVQGRAGLYQPGGAWGFRDQLQDMLALIDVEPSRARAHLLRCAARQFGAGDVLHWWHEPCRGIRTRVSDDMLFLPWVAAEYVKRTGDAGVLDERMPYLEDVPIPEGQSGVYQEMKPGETAGSLHEHCMRAFRRAARKGTHGLLLMGAGDWNDGMNRVGDKGRGESVWLSQFAIACANAYRQIAPIEEDRVWLWRLGEELRVAVERYGWDGEWYLRAYDDDGHPLGSADNDECQIDILPQAWAVLAGLDEGRRMLALDNAWERLVDEKPGVIRLLAPPFDGIGRDPGYIRGYPPGVRENGGQYTHAALWLLLALTRAGDADRAHRALQMLLPYNHADTPEKARAYRVEPYVMAADVYDCPGHRGQGGWTWYTGAAGWMLECLKALMGYERRGDRVRLNALLGDWSSAAMEITFGKSVYRLVCDRETPQTTLDGVPVDGDFIRMVDDGRNHEARFHAREANSIIHFPFCIVLKDITHN